MPRSPLLVVIVGGGLGGLCLAQGLLRVGVGVAVYERDGAPHTRGQSYRIHIDERGAQGLRACLPPNCTTSSSRRPGGPLARSPC